MPAPIDPENKVNVPSVGYNHMKPDWDMLDALWGGTRAMREAGDKYLPREPKEDAGHWENRLNRTVLYNAYRDTVEKLGGKPFSKPIQIDKQETLPEPIQEMLKDVNRRGVDLTTYSREWFTEAIHRGIAHCLVDYPVLPQQATLAEEKQAGGRPVFLPIKASDIVGWRSQVEPNGQETLTEIRIKECRVEPKGTYGDHEVEYIRRITVSTWELWRHNVTKDDWELSESGTHTAGEVPLRTMYIGKKIGFMMAEPPMINLAHLNVAHWQSSSDQRNCLRFARVGLLFASGFSDEQIEKGIVVGPSKLISTENTQAKLSYVEHSGAAIQSGERDLEKLEKLMEVMGAQPLIERSGNQTATGKSIDESRTSSVIQAWIRVLENSLEECFQLAAKWMGVKMPADFKINVFSEFVLSLNAATDVTALTTIRANGDIDRVTFIGELKRRGLLADNVTPESIQAELDNEGESLGNMFPPTIPNPPPRKVGAVA